MPFLCLGTISRSRDPQHPALPVRTFGGGGAGGRGLLGKGELRLGNVGRLSSSSIPGSRIEGLECSSFWAFPSAEVFLRGAGEARPGTETGLDLD